ncbi:MAG: HlyD family efflux transporter periplasmic adaptor subunit [Armatimonadetes bacterium]|nr:HlyD family efflux transporter periplasmic adaptor subunit [Armatimonadota bacterium]
MSDDTRRQHGPPRAVRIAVPIVLVAATAAVVAYRVHARQASSGDLRVSGIVEARTIEVASEVAGRVIECPVQEGEQVVAGQVLCVVASEPTAAAVEQAEAALQAAQDQVARANEALLLQIGVSDQDMARAAAAVGTAQARYGDIRDGARPQELEAAAAQVTQAQASLTAAQAQLRQLETGLRPEEIRQAEKAHEAATAEAAAARSRLADLEAGARPQELDEARAMVAKAEAAQRRAQKDYQRGLALVEQGAMAPNALDALKAAAEATDADLAAARQRLSLAQAGTREEQVKAARAQLEAAIARQQSTGEALTLARKGPRQEEIDRARAAVRLAEGTLKAAQAQLRLLQAGARKGQTEVARKQVREAETGLGLAKANQRQVQLRRSEAAAARAQQKQAEAALKQARANLDKFVITAQVDGLVDDTHVRVGETVRPGSAVATLVDYSDTWVTVYVPEPRLSQIRVGTPVEVTVDGQPGEAFQGTVRRIGAQAEFTPKYVQTLEERARTVFPVEIALPNTQGVLKPGMPADAVFRAADLLR